MLTKSCHGCPASRHGDSAAPLCLLLDRHKLWHTNTISRKHTHTQTHAQCVCDEQQFRLLLMTHCANLSGCTHAQLTHIHTYIHTHSISIWQEGTDSQLIPPARWLTTKNIRRVYFSKWAIIIKIIKRAQRRRVSEWGDAREMRTV